VTLNPQSKELSRNLKATETQGERVLRETIMDDPGLEMNMVEFACGGHTPGFSVLVTKLDMEGAGLLSVLFPNRQVRARVHRLSRELKKHVGAQAYTGASV
jgi:hypothetical protein